MEPSHARRLAGFKAKKRGQEWEILFSRECLRQNIQQITIPDGCKQVYKKLIRVKTPFDCILVNKQSKRKAFLDTKSISAKNIEYGFLTEHQIEALLALESETDSAGYLVLFRDTNRVYFFPASLLASIFPGQSAKREQALFVGDLNNMALGTIFK